MEDGTLDAVVVGAGQCGLGVSRCLAGAGIGHVVLERGRIGESWLSQRWDGFHMNTNNRQSAMPGQPYDGPDPRGFMGARDWVARLEGFAQAGGLPVRTGVAVQAVTPDPAGFRIETSAGVLRARNLVCANGSMTKPRRPALAALLPATLAQLHAAEYRNAAALPPGGVLVVGSSQSGVQIAAELCGAGRRVFLATSRIGRMPRHHRGGDMSEWMQRCGNSDRRARDLADPSVIHRPPPLIAPHRTLSLQALSAAGVVLLGRLRAVEGRVLRFSDDVAANIRAADETAAAMRRDVDACIARLGLYAPAEAPDPDETVAPVLPDPAVTGIDLGAGEIAAVLWATGFDGDHSWLRLPGALDERGLPVHEDGASPWPGLFYMGLPWMTRRRSTLVTGVEVDAPWIAGLVAARLGVAMPA